MEMCGINACKTNYNIDGDMNRTDKRESQVTFSSILA